MTEPDDDRGGWLARAGSGATRWLCGKTALVIFPGGPASVVTLTGLSRAVCPGYR